MSKRNIDPAVVAVIRAWSDPKKDSAASASVLAEGRLSLSPTLLPVLRSEVAEISAEILVELIAREDGVADAKAEPTEFMGMKLMPKQLERVAGWAHDQKATAQALGVELENWQKMIEVGMQAYIDGKLGKVSGSESGKSPAASQEAARLSQAQKLIGAVATTPLPASKGPTEQSGLRGMLGARMFQNPKDKK